MIQTTTRNEELAAKHKRFVLTPWVAQGGHTAPTIVRGEGVRIYDADGNAYLDLSSGLVATNLGHSHPRVVAAIREQAERICFVPPGLFSDVRAQLAEELVALGPWPEGGRAYFTAAGADANEDAMKLARSVTGRPKILTAYRSFHGSSYGASTLSGENRRWGAEPGIAGVTHFFAPFPYRSPFHTRDGAEEVSRALAHLSDVMTYENPRSIAAVLLEPVVGSNGVIVYPEGYLAGVRALCDRHGILLVFDEVMTGFGRTGAAFGGERFGVVPDLLTFAKGVTSGYVPLGGVLIRESLAATFDERALVMGHTYSGHPLAMATALATLAAYREEGLFERALEIEAILRAGLGALQARHPMLGEVRGVGAFFGLEFVRDRETREPLVPWQGAGPGVMATFFGALRRRGAYAFGRFNTVVISPPLIATQAELEEGMVALDGAIGELEAAASK
jgi:taurine--2-oxoglutarate transaminase